MVNDKYLIVMKFEFTIQGNDEGIQLALYIPSHGLDNRIKSTIRNGKFVFRGKYNGRFLFVFICACIC